MPFPAPTVRGSKLPPPQRPSAETQAYLKKAATTSPSVSDAALSSKPSGLPPPPRPNAAASVFLAKSGLPPPMKPNMPGLPQASADLPPRPASETLSQSQSEKKSDSKSSFPAMASNGAVAPPQSAFPPPMQPRKPMPVAVGDRKPMPSPFSKPEVDSTASNSIEASTGAQESQGVPPSGPQNPPSTLPDKPNVQQEPQNTAPNKEGVQQQQQQQQQPGNVTTTSVTQPKFIGQKMPLPKTKSEQPQFIGQQASTSQKSNQQQRAPMLATAASVSSNVLGSTLAFPQQNSMEQKAEQKENAKASNTSKVPSHPFAVPKVRGPPLPKTSALTPQNGQAAANTPKEHPSQNAGGRSHGGSGKMPPSKKGVHSGFLSSGASQPNKKLPPPMPRPNGGVLPPSKDNGIIPGPANPVRAMPFPGATGNSMPLPNKVGGGLPLSNKVGGGLPDSMPSKTNNPTPVTNNETSAASGQEPVVIRPPRAKPKFVPKVVDHLTFSPLTKEVLEERKRKRNYPIPFPIFCICWPQMDTVIIGGGGGTAGCGVPSAGLLCDMKQDLNRPLQRGKWDKSSRWDVIPKGEMSTHDMILCQAAQHPTTDDFAFAVGGRVYLVTLTNGRLLHKNNNFAQMDFSSEVSEQNVSALRFNRSGDCLVSGGSDRVVRLWSWPAMKKIQDLGSHDKEDLVSLDFNMSGSIVASTSGEKYCNIWRTQPLNVQSSKDDTKERHLIKKLTLKNGKDFMEYRVCRFVSGEQGQEFLCVLMNGSSRGPSFLAKYSTTSWALIKKVKICSDPAVGMEVSHDHSKVAVANNEGGVFIFDTNLALFCKQSGCHDLPTTGLAWSADDQWVLSASADKTTAVVPAVQQRSTTCRSVFLLVLNAFLVLFLYVVLQIVHSSDSSELK
eukprot:CAMPEP_0175140108 /NCGR_PEP_ID=MMETSP0087-20121206/11279_1 /TAXON_ID=136419 /ORGANISM="Unknown Unknown, Strain D1" /LENGTH=893 /DNA_ID=CAMNT_0016423201 /DNA_START=35 /DNA_END=2716 /DNA_ORIENTATION=+